MPTNDMHGYLISVPIPWDQDGKFLPELFQAAIEQLVQQGCDGLYLFGTSGEGYAVTDAEFVQIVEAFVDHTANFVGFRQVCCFGLSSDQVKHRCQLAKDRGISSVQVTLPFWKELNDAELKKYFADVCGSNPDSTFLLYNNPRNKRRLTGVELQSLYEESPNLQGVKTGSGNWLELYELIIESPSLQHFVTEPAFLFCYGLGNVGLIPSSNYALPKRCRAYYDAVVRSDLETGQRLHREITSFFHKTAAPLVQKGYIDGAIDKAYARIGGMDMPLNMKSPYVSLSEEDYQWLQSVVEKL